MSTNRKILIFDTWTAYEGKLKALEKVLYNSNEIYFVHTNYLMKKYASKQINKHFKNLEKPLDTNTIDFRKFNYDPIKCLSTINPDLVVFLSIHNIEQRFFNHACKKLGIKTCFLMHGLIMHKNFKSLPDKSLVKLILSNIRRVMYFVIMIKYYLRSIIKYKFLTSKGMYVDMFNSIFFRRAFKSNPAFKYNVQLDYLLYTRPKDKPFLENYMGKEFQKSFNFYSIDVMNLVASYISEKQEENIKNKNSVLFFSQPLYEKNLDNLGFEDYIKLLKHLKEEFAKLNYEFKVRLHPREDEKVIGQSIDESFFDHTNSLEKAVFSYDYFVTIGSTAIMLPIFLTKPGLVLKNMYFNEPFELSNQDNDLLVECSCYDQLPNKIKRLVGINTGTNLDTRVAVENYLGGINSVIGC